MNRCIEAEQSTLQTVLQHDGSFSGFLCALAEGINMTRRSGNGNFNQAGSPTIR
jgi:hypothetical protein